MTKKTNSSEKDIKNTEPSTINLAADTLTGDIASFLIDRLRNEEIPFKRMSEDQQQEIIDAARRAAAHLVAQAVEIIASGGKDSLPVKVSKVVNDGKKIQITLEANKEDEHRHALFDAANCAAHLTVADAEQFEGGDTPKPIPDQPDMIVDETGKDEKLG